MITAIFLPCPQVKSSIKLQNVFRRVSQGAKGHSISEHSQNGDDGPNGAKKAGGGLLFGRPLDQICKGNALPNAVSVSVLEAWQNIKGTWYIFQIGLQKQDILVQYFQYKPLSSNSPSSPYPLGDHQ